MGAHLLGQSQPQNDVPQPTIHPGNEDQWAELRKQREHNAALITQLKTFNQAMDPFSTFMTKLAAVIEVMWPSGTPHGQAKQIQVELAFETMMGDVLSEARRMAVMAQLAAGAQINPAHLEPVSRRNGRRMGPGLPPG